MSLAALDEEIKNGMPEKCPSSCTRDYASLSNPESGNTEIDRYRDFSPEKIPVIIFTSKFRAM